MDWGCKFTVLAEGVEPPAGMRMCRRGLHWFIPKVSKVGCTECNRESRRVYQNSRRACPEKRARHNESCRKYAQKPEVKAYQRAMQRQYSTGHTPEYFEARKQEQDGKCAFCEAVLDFTIGALRTTTAHADHCHDTGNPRGILCMKCNIALGHYEKTLLPQIDKVKAYLAKYSK